MKKESWERIVKIRAFSDKLKEMMKNGEIGDFLALPDGNEVAAVAVCDAMTERDYLFANHRNFEWYLARGGELVSLFREVMSREGGICRGWGGFDYTIDVERGYLGSAVLLGQSITIPLGIAYGVRGEGRAVVGVVGDGGTCEGVFYEALNVAALYSLPIMFVVMDNCFSVHKKITEYRANWKVWKIAKAIGVDAKGVCGWDYDEVYETAKKALDLARKNSKPFLLHVITYRLVGHTGYGLDVGEGLRTEEEVQFYRSTEPLANVQETEEYENAKKEVELAYLKAKKSKIIEEAVWK